MPESTPALPPARTSRGTAAAPRRRARAGRRAAALTAACSAVTLLLGGGGAPATAADGRTFPQMLAQLRGCESGGNYAINTGNGYYGAYQFDLGTWQAVGGSGYPHQNPPAVQDEMATRLYEQRGWSPWPSCSRSLGLYPVPVQRTATGTVPVGVVDVTAGQVGGVHVAGWAFDRDNDPAAIQVHVYVDTTGTALVASGARPDVAAVYGVGGSHGFDAVLPAAPGPHHVCSYAINVGVPDVNPVLACTDVVVPQAPVGHLDKARVRGHDDWVVGWAMDPDVPGASLRTDVYVDGVFARAVLASSPRPDVARAYGAAAGAAHGYRVSVPAGSQVCVYAYDTTGAAPNTQVGCLTPGP